jgi:hypothetical protein
MSFGYVEQRWKIVTIAPETSNGLIGRNTDGDVFQVNLSGRSYLTLCGTNLVQHAIDLSGGDVTNTLPNSKTTATHCNTPCTIAARNSDGDTSFHKVTTCELQVDGCATVSNRLTAGDLKADNCVSASRVTADDIKANNCLTTSHLTACDAKIDNCMQVDELKACTVKIRGCNFPLTTTDSKYESMSSRLGYGENHGLGCVHITATGCNPSKGPTHADQIFGSKNGTWVNLKYSYGQCSGGSAGSGDYLFALPDGYAVDTTNYGYRVDTCSGTGRSDYTKSIIGTGWVVTDEGCNRINVICVLYSTTTFRVFGPKDVGIIGHCSDYSMDKVVGYEFDITFPVPIPCE